MTSFEERCEREDEEDRLASIKTYVRLPLDVAVACRTPKDHPDRFGWQYPKEENR